MSIPPPPMPQLTFASGQKRYSVLPEELRGWNWGAFFFSWMWGPKNGTYMPFWVFLFWLMGIGFIWNIVCGVKGNEWAWKARAWESHEEFKRVQRIWALAAPVVLLAFVMLIVVVAAIDALIG